MDLKVEIKGDTEMVKALERMRTKAVPYALRNTLNTAAFETRKIWQAEIKRSFTNRNPYTERSIRVEQASIQKLEAKTGSVADYMDEQEEGATIKGSGKHKAIPGPVAAGQGDGAKRTRLVRARFYLGAINVAHPGAHGGRRQSNAIAIQVARKTGKNLVLLKKRNGGRGLFIISGGKRTLRTRMLWDMSRSSVKVKPEPTLQRSLSALKPKLAHMLEAATMQQMQRFNVGS